MLVTGARPQGRVGGGMALRQASLLNHLRETESAMMIDGGGAPRWAALTEQEESDMRANLDRWAKEEDDEEGFKPNYYYDKEEGLKIRSEIALSRVRRFRFLELQPAQDGAVAWERVEGIDQQQQRLSFFF